MDLKEATIPHEATPDSQVSPDADDAALLQRIRLAPLAKRFEKLWTGDWSAAGCASAIDADLALCSILAFWTKRDPASVDRLFRQSALFRAEEWDQQVHNGITHGAQTLSRACSESLHLVDRSAQAPPHPPTEKQTQPTECKPELSDWPTLDRHTLPGLVGEFITLTSSGSEADPAAILATLLCRFGAEVYGHETGQGPYCYVGETKHYPRLFVAVVGDTAKSRKGTSAGPVNALFRLPRNEDDVYSLAATTGGPLSSGEGLVYCVRDERKEWQIAPRSDNGRWLVVDPGVTDKRLFILDEELAAAMASLKREGCTLSAALRQVWDSGCYSPMTKRERTSCTDAHINIVTHTTRAELSHMLEEVQVLNGFANRFLWVCARRNKIVPDPTRLDSNALASMQGELKQLLVYAKQVSEMRRSEQASALWREAYPDLSAEHPGIAGAVVARAEAHVVRLSIIYALLDGQNIIEERHLRAALAFWDYCRESAIYLFPRHDQDQISAQVVSLLRAGPLTGTELYRGLANHVTKSALTRALDGLIASGKAICKVEQTAGRPRRTYALGR